MNTFESDHTAIIVRPTGGQHRQKFRRAATQIGKLNAWFVHDIRGHPRRNRRDGTFEVRSRSDKNQPAIKLLLQLSGFRIVREVPIPNPPEAPTEPVAAVRH